MKTLTTVFLVLFLSINLFAQTDTLNIYKIREYGVNTTPFLQQFVSIGNTNNLAPARAFMYKRFKPNKKRGLRFGLGLHVEDRGFFEEEQIFHISVGSERRRTIGKNWFYYFGYDGFLSSRPFTVRNSVFGIGFGADVVLGIVYQINKHLSLSTETIFAASSGDGSFFTRISPPLSLYLNFRTFKRKYY